MNQPVRRRPQQEVRSCLTHEFSVDGKKAWVTVGFYEDNSSPCEVFISMGNEGSLLISSVLESFSKMVSILLQYGVPLESIVEDLIHDYYHPQYAHVILDTPFAEAVIGRACQWLASLQSAKQEMSQAPTFPSESDIHP